MPSDLGIHIIRQHEYIEKVFISGLNVGLISGGNGTEIIHHHLNKGVHWYIGPAPCWQGFEYIFILAGKLECNSSRSQTVLYPHDSFSAKGVTEIIEFMALEETEFIYFSSEPVFHNYSHQLRELIDLSIVVEEKDGHTSEHCKRIRDLSLQVGRDLGLTGHEISMLHFGSFFHDVGKTEIPDGILRKPGKFTNEEYKMMKTHARLGKDILVKTGNPLLIEASIIVEQHHERFNGSGYPVGLKGDEISTGAAIVAVVDSYDAMVSNRVYRTAKAKSTALQEIEQNRGILYHPLVVDSFLRIIGNGE